MTIAKRQGLRTLAGNPAHAPEPPTIGESNVTTPDNHAAATEKCICIFLW